MVGLFMKGGLELAEGERRPPRWLEAELVLACDIVAQNNWKAVRVGDPRTVELSRLLRAAKWHPLEDRGSTFRNLNSVQRKTFDIATSHRSYRGKRTKGGKLDGEILQQFIEQPTEMHTQAAALRAGIHSGELIGLPEMVDVNQDETAREGRVLILCHLRRERNLSLRTRKIKKALTERGCLECEVCGFDFARIYGERGYGYAEVHHLTPLHVTGPVHTGMGDLAVLCANCHRMIHRGPRWLSPDELRELVRTRCVEVGT
jgi:5-methylcytosine-specific restriction enzyme A